MPKQGAVMITGASTGIGRACALALIGAGHRVFAGIRNPEAAASLLSAAPSGLVPIELDVTDAEQATRAAERVTAELKGEPLLGLVNNAGIAVTAPIEFLPLDDLRRQFEVNVIGQVAVIQAFLPLLRLRPGRIVNISSTSGFFSAPLMGAYAASKHAIEALSDALRLEVASAGIRVAVVQPGAIATPIWEKSVAAALSYLDAAPAEIHEHYGHLIEAGRRAAERAQVGASPPQVVARDVVHALTSKRPRSRYLQGKGARLEWSLSLLPDALRDRLVLRYFERLRAQ